MPTEPTLALTLAPRRAALPSGHPALDAALVDGGWPRGALSELLLATPGIGELPLLLPALAAQVRDSGRVALVAAPWLPCLPAWQAAGIAVQRLLWLDPPDARSWLWSCEQAARVPGCAVLAWPGHHPLAMRELRRLQLAAQEGGNLFALLRDSRATAQPSPAALRLELAAGARGQLRITVRKQRGSAGGRQLLLPLHETRARKRLAAWQLPVHVPPRTPHHLPEEITRAVARPAPAPGIAAVAVDHGDRP